ncbi:hypothetical protein [Escherichia coli]|uniref:hypothetical protein n=1 Tax=Escherichia coli TaxID=562 RepID=UPI00388DC847
MDAETAQAIISSVCRSDYCAVRQRRSPENHRRQTERGRVLTCGQWGERVPGLDFKTRERRSAGSDRDPGAVGAEELRVVTKRQPSEQNCVMRCSVEGGEVCEIQRYRLCQNNMTIGIGAGQMSRVYSAKIAGIKAPMKASGSERFLGGF